MCLVYRTFLWLELEQQFQKHEARPKKITADWKVVWCGSPIHFPDVTAIFFSRLWLFLFNFKINSCPLVVWRPIHTCIRNNWGYRIKTGEKWKKETRTEWKCHYFKETGREGFTWDGFVKEGVFSPSRPKFSLPQSTLNVRTYQPLSEERVRDLVTQYGGTSNPKKEGEKKNTKMLEISYFIRCSFHRVVWNLLES